MSGLTLTTRGVVVLAVLILAAIVLLAVAVSGMLPPLGASPVTDAMWQDGLDWHGRG